jgi:glycosyltransferase involved in cell wall biosynthesis
VSAAPRVLVVHNRYRIEGGEERSVDLQLRALEAAGVEHALFERRSADAGRGAAARAMLRGGADPAELADAVRLLATGGERSCGSGRTSAASAASPARVVVHAHNTVPLIGPAGLAAARAAGARVVLHLHNVRIFCATGFGERDGAPCQRCRGRNTLPGLALNCRGSLPEAAVYATALAAHQPRLLAAVDRFVAPSAAARDELAARGLPADRVEVLRHYLPADAFADRSAAGEGGYALVASRLSPEKGIEDAVRACVSAGVPLRIAGEGPERERLERLARELGEDVAVGAPAAAGLSGGALSEGAGVGSSATTARDRAAPSVTFLGRLPAEAVRDQLAGAAMVLMPSRYHEFSPYSALEALAAGVPVVATAMGGLPELLGEGRCVPVGDIPAFAAGVAALWEDPDARAAEGDAAIARARERHSLDRYAADLLALYDALS